MRNVTIWRYRDIEHDNAFPAFVRVYQFKGRTQTLNQFLYPDYILRDGHLCGRGADKPVVPWSPGAKGQTVVMGYQSSDDLWAGKGVPLVVLNSFEHALSWLNGNDFYFYGDESDRRVGVRKYVNYHGRQEEYRNMAEAFDNNPPPRPPVPQQAYEYKARADEVLLPRAKNVVDNSDLNELLASIPTAPVRQKEESPSFDMTEPVDRSGGFGGQDPELPPILEYPPKLHVGHKSFFRRVWDFLTK